MAIYDPTDDNRLEQHEDWGLSPEELSQKYDLEVAGQHPDFALSEWKWAVTNEDTRRGYWEWVAAQIEEWTGE